MSDLHVVAIIPAKPGSEETVRGLLGDLATATRAEDGCLSYDVLESGSAPGTFLTLEEWRSQEDLDAHLASDHVASAIGAATPHLAGEIAIHPLGHVD